MDGEPPVNQGDPGKMGHSESSSTTGLDCDKVHIKRERVSQRRLGDRLPKVSQIK